MRDYGKLAPTFWTRGSGKKLRGNPVAQVVAAYLSTSPGANMIGIYYVPIDTIAHDTGLTLEQVREGLSAVEVAGYARYDHDAELAWVPNHSKVEIGPAMKSGDKRRPRVIAELAHVHDHPFADQFLGRYGESYGLRMPPAPTESKGHRRGIEGASTQPDGGTADLGQDRAGQDRAGQDRAGQDRTGTGQDRAEGHAPFAPGTASAVEAKAVFEESVTEVTGRPFASGSAPFHVRDLCDAINTHAPKEASKTEALAWLKSAVGDWIRAIGGKGTIQPSKLLDWLNEGKPDKRSKAGPKGAAVQSMDGACFKIPEGF